MFSLVTGCEFAFYLNVLFVEVTVKDEIHRTVEVRDVPFTNESALFRALQLALESGYLCTTPGFTPHLYVQAQHYFDELARARALELDGSGPHG